MTAVIVFGFFLWARPTYYRGQIRRVLAIDKANADVIKRDLGFKDIVWDQRMRIGRISCVFQEGAGYPRAR